ncbi:phytoene desaturase family protein [Amycolatopsis taiwanensis]|uniref:phytoene desaturase family protein n=1 Tax=Amycolatopsis taiwanensis TaxID=342230 RepID=UPI00048720DC|nr:NAD(P)/FAD-dependent oxidoreductase [Amycolatopsis taiwanensis]
MAEAIVVGSGPNGLAAAVVLARAGLKVTVLEAAGEIGGGARSGEATLPGLLYDHCAAVHPIAAGSPFLGTLDLERYGLRWRHAPLPCAHPLPSGDAAVLHRSVEATAAALGVDGPRWRALFGPSADHYPALAGDLLRPVPHLPRRPLRLAQFGALAALPASTVAGLFRTGRARALFGGVAAHAIRPLDHVFTSAIALGLLSPVQHDGWPVAEGGSGRIAAALAAALTDFGGAVETGVHIRDAAELPPSAITMYDLAPAGVAAVLGDRLPSPVARAYQRFRNGPAVYKVDLAVAEGIPWRNPEVAEAGTVHVGGSFAQTAASLRTVHNGRMPAKPFVLVGQQYLADPTRSHGNIHPVSAYAHVPHAYPGDATDAIIARIEEFAPGFRHRILAISADSPADLANDNPNFIGGDILTGAKTSSQLLLGPRLVGNPYRTGIPGSYLCSAATPPGPGAHGMCGANAAALALRDLRRRRRSP